MNRVLAVVLFACAFSLALPAQTSLSETAAADTTEDRNAKHSEIRRLIELTGAANVSTQVLQQIVEPIRHEFPQVPTGFWDGFIKEVRADELVDLVVPLYDRYYTRQEIHDLTVFYQSPVGQKTVKVLPKLSAEAISVGQDWGRTVAERAIKKLTQQGYDKTSSLAPENSPSGQ
jgi:hypothetical protein